MSSTTGGSPPLAGRTALVSGGSRGIGLETARALHGAGARVVILGRDMDAMTSGLKSFASSHTQAAAAFAVDLAAPEAITRTLATVRDHLAGAPDVIVNNAGHFFLKRADFTSVEEFRRTLAVNLTASFAIVREFLEDMRVRRRGHIVTIGSIADHRAFPENAAYAASKYGVRGLHEVLREELRGSGVRATLVSPGPVDTTLWDEVDPDMRPGFTRRADMLSAAAVADAVHYVVTRAADVNVDELRISHS